MIFKRDSIKMNNFFGINKSTGKDRFFLKEGVI